MDSKRPNRRGFLKGSAALAGLAAGGSQLAKGQTQGTTPKKIDELIAYGDRFRFVTSIRKPVAGRHSPDEFGLTLWDYINRGMPLGSEGSLSPNEVYSLTAFLLFKNDVIKEDEVMDAQSLPKVKMPNRDGFALAPEWKPREPRLQGYP